MSDTAARIWPIVSETYGESGFTRDFTLHIARKIDKWPDGQPNYGAEDRENMIRLTCWDWFSGGTTAESTARKIEERLASASTRKRCS